MSKHSLEDTAQPKHDLKRRKKDKSSSKDKKSRKEALRLEDITPSSTEATAESTPVPEHNSKPTNIEKDEDDSSRYTPNPALNAITHRDVDAFLNSQAVKIADPK